MKYSFRFVCQGGGLDVKALLLACSLIENLNCDFELIACIPADPHFIPPDKKIVEILHQLDVQIQKIRSPISQDYPIGNKISCMEIESESDIKVFLDSDILCTKSFYEFPLEKDVDFLAKLEDWHHHETDEWNRLYNFLNLGSPKWHYKSTVLNESMPLYFNAGVLVVRNTSSLPSLWKEMALHIKKSIDLPRMYPNLDQLSLATTIIKNDISYKLLDESFNYPTELRPLDHSNIPFFCHYHDPLYILADEFLTGIVVRLCSKFPTLKTILYECNIQPLKWASINSKTPLVL